MDMHTSYIPKLQGIPYPTIQSIEIHRNSIIQLLHAATCKAYGPDKIPGHLLKEIAVKFYPILLH